MTNGLIKKIAQSLERILFTNINSELSIETLIHYVFDEINLTFERKHIVQALSKIDFGERFLLLTDDKIELTDDPKRAKAKYNKDLVELNKYRAFMSFNNIEKMQPC